MTTLNKTGTSVAALSIFMTGSAAFADVSSQQVWDDWKDYMTGFGYQMESSEAMSGGTLTVSDIVMSMELPEDQGGFAMSFDEMTFSDNSDGTVSISIPEVMPLNVSVDGENEKVDVALEYRTTGFSMNVSGDVDNMTYNYSTADVTVALSELTVDGTTIDVGSASMSMANVTGTTVLTSGNLRTSSQNMSTGPVSYSIDFTNPEKTGRFVMEGGFDGMRFNGTGSIPNQMDPNDMAGMLAAGFGVDGGFSYENGRSNINFQEEGKSFQASSSADAGQLDVAMDAGKLRYGGSLTNMTMQMQGNEIPLPIDVSMAQMAFNLLMPVGKSDDEQDFALALNLGDFEVSDLIWGMLDPSGQLPRDPSTVAFDLSGKAKLFFDLLDPEQAEMSADMPGELNALNLNSLTVRAAGAELTGDGAFTFDNTDLTTFDGVPAPTGAIDLQLVGGNGLMDKLIAMGLLPEDQAMGMRMMMGMFAVAGEGEDTITSKIEVSADGQVKANGQRLK